MADERKLRGAKQLEEGYCAGFKDGYDVGLSDAETLRGLRDRVAGEHGKKVQAGLDRLKAAATPRRRRKERKDEEHTNG